MNAEIKDCHVTTIYLLREENATLRAAFETLAILVDPVLSKALRKSIEEAKEGKLLPFEEIERRLS